MIRRLFTSKKFLVLTLSALLLFCAAGSAFYFYRSVAKVVRLERETVATEKMVAAQENPIFLQRRPGYELLTSVSDINDLCFYQGLYYTATNAGLIVYDTQGDVKAHYTTLDQLPTNHLQTLAVYRDRLMIGTRGAGMLLFDGQRFSHLRPKERKYASVTALHTTPQGALFIGTQSGGVLVYDGQRMEKFSPAVLGRQHITSFSGDSNDLAIATYDDGLYVWREGKLTHYDKAQGLLDAQVTSLLRTDTNLYVGSPLGIARMETGIIKGNLLYGAFVTAISSAHGALLVGTFDQGVVNLDTTLSPRRRIGGSRDLSYDTSAFTSVRRLIAGDGAFMALTEQGIYRGEVGLGDTVHWRRFDRPATTASLSDGNVASMAVDKTGKLWVGSFDRGLDVLDPGGTLLKHYQDDTLYCINHISVDPISDMVYVATSNGLVTFDAQRQFKVSREKTGLISNHITHVLPARLTGVDLAVTTAEGISLVENTKIKSLYAFHGLVNNRVYTSAAAGDKLYFGTLGGISVLQGGSLTEHFTTANSGLAHNWVNALLNVNGVLFVGTYGGGVQALHADRTWENFSEPIGKFEVNPNAMYFDGRKVYVGTLDRGLYVYYLDTRTWEHWVAGLPSLNVTAITADKAHVFVGTDNGVLKLKR
jgi:ligand-binding sensor domain-containing protein